MRVLVCVSDGIGNIFEILPVVSTLEAVKGWDISMCLCDAPYHIGRKILQRPVYTMSGIIPAGIHAAFDGVIATGKAWDKMGLHFGIDRSRLEPVLLNDPDKQRLKDVQEWTRSEIDWRLDIARNMDVPDRNMVYTHPIGTADAPAYEVVIADGYNHSNSGQCWEVKSYPRWNKVAELLRLARPEINISSIGQECEHVGNTEDETGRPLSESLGIVRNATVLLCNDTGMYHAAALINTPTVTAFTFTSLTKNYDIDFHTSCEIVARSLQCRQGCYKSGRVRDCQHHKCRDIDPNTIVNKALEVLH